MATISPGLQSILDSYNNLPTYAQTPEATKEVEAAIQSYVSGNGGNIYGGASSSTSNTDIGQNSSFMDSINSAYRASVDYVRGDTSLEDYNKSISGADSSTSSSSGGSWLSSLFKVSGSSVLAVIVGFVLLLGAFLIYRK